MSSRASCNKQINEQKNNFKECDGIKNGNIGLCGFVCRLRHLGRFIYDR